MELYNEDLDDEELFLLNQIARKRKIKKAIIIGIISLVVLTFIIVTIMAVLYKEPLYIDDIVQQNEF